MLNGWRFSSLAPDHFYRPIHCQTSYYNSFPFPMVFSSSFPWTFFYLLPSSLLGFIHPFHLQNLRSSSINSPDSLAGVSYAIFHPTLSDLDRHFQPQGEQCWSPKTKRRCSLLQLHYYILSLLHRTLGKLRKQKHLLSGTLFLLLFFFLFFFPELYNLKGKRGVLKPLSKIPFLSAFSPFSTFDLSLSPS